MPIIRLLDNRIMGWRCFSGNSNLADEESFHRFREEARNNTQLSLVNSSLHDLANIDTKSTALLTHMSVIIAALVFALGEVGNGLVRFLIAIELIAYVSIALLNLRCLNIMGPPHMGVFENGEAYEKALVSEVFVRRCVYVFCLRAVCLLTAILPAIILIEMLSDWWG